MWRRDPAHLHQVQPKKGPRAATTQSDAKDVTLHHNGMGIEADFGQSREQERERASEERVALQSELFQATFAFSFTKIVQILLESVNKRLRETATFQGKILEG